MSDPSSPCPGLPRSASERKQLDSYNAYYFLDATGQLQLWTDEFGIILSFSTAGYGSPTEIMRTLRIAYRIHREAVERGIGIGVRQIRAQLHAVLGTHGETEIMQEKISKLESTAHTHADGIIL
jgi:hypothetical protein